MRSPEPASESQRAKPSQIPDPEKLCKIRNVCGLTLKVLGVICYKQQYFFVTGILNFGVMKEINI